MYRLVEVLLRPAIGFWFSWRLDGMDLVPPDGPVLVAGNHVSHFDPLAHGYFLTGAGRRPRYLAKSDLWKNGFLRRVLDGTHQIPVERGTGRAAPVDAAVNGLERGEVVVIYPEATTTRNADQTPMQGKTGIARVAIRSGVPVLPLAVWGTHHILQRGHYGLNPRRAIWVRAGRPMEFGEYAGQAEDPVVLRKVTDEVMDELTRLVGDMRREYPARWA
jgi:1-acyl-sn-glycerol-3-phosphate acyltransferase